MIEIFKDVIDDAAVHQQVVNRLNMPDFPWSRLVDINYPDSHAWSEPGESAALENEPLIHSAVMDGAMSCFYLLEDHIGDDRRAWNMYRCKANRTSAVLGSDNAYLGAHIDDACPVAHSRRFTCVYYPEDSEGELIVWDRVGTDPAMTADQVARLLALERPRVVLEFQPRANHMVMFPANLYHRALPPRSGQSRLAINMVWGIQTQLIATPEW